MRAILDLDFDFFWIDPSWVGMDTDEGRSKEISDLIWQTRVVGAVQQGYNIYKQLKSPVDIHPLEFWDVVSAKFDFSGCDRILYSDSHASVGAELPRYLDHNQEYAVWHFDSHHDLFYSERKFLDHLSKNICNCGNWLGVVGATLPEVIREINVVYPEWRRLPLTPGEYPRLEVSYMRQAELVQFFAKYGIRINFYFFNEILQADMPKQEVEVITACLSSEWSPPWGDVFFKELIQTAPVQQEMVEIEDARWVNGFVLRPFPLTWEAAVQTYRPIVDQGLLKKVLHFAKKRPAVTKAAE